MSEYASLHTHSEHSFLDGYATVEQIAKRAKSLGHSAVALTDHAEVGGHLLFQKACKEEGIKPIFGCEGYLVDSVTRVRKEKDRVNSHITLLAQNQKGLENLWAWTSEAYEKNFYYRALADWEHARKYAEGLYASDGCLLAFMARALSEDDMERAEQLASQYLSVFGERFYMELHTWQFMEPTTQEEFDLNAQMSKVNQGKVEVAKKLGIPLVVVNDAHYAYPEHWENHALVWKMSTQGDIDKTESRTAAWIMSDEELYYWMSKHGVSRDVTEEAIKNTHLIAENCNAEIVSDYRMPQLSKSSRDDLELFLNNVEKGFQRKVVEKGLPVEEYYKRMEMEIQLITEKDFAGYFNVVADYVKWAKTEGEMLVGPARGSAGGSLVSYLLDITEVNPLKYGLLFERFMSPSRGDTQYEVEYEDGRVERLWGRDTVEVSSGTKLGRELREGEDSIRSIRKCGATSLPDIDVDFPQTLRPKVKEYLQARFGHDHVCGIGTRSRLQPRGILADLSRAMGIPQKDSRAIASIIDTVSDIDTANVEVSWDEVLQEKGGELGEWATKYPELFQKMGEMVGMVRQSSTHAAGVLISSKPLTGDLPTRVKNGQRVSAFDGPEVESEGFVKFDILGLRHLSGLQVVSETVKKLHGVDLDFYHFNDPRPVYEVKLEDGTTKKIVEGTPVRTSEGVKLVEDLSEGDEI